MLRNQFKTKKNYILASLLIGTYDVNRNELLPNDDFEIVRKWYNSIINLRLNGIIFHNTFTEKTVKTYQNEFVQFIKVAYNKDFNPNVYRYFIYQKFILKNKNSIENLFVTDIADVEVKQNPFKSDLFLNQNDFLFCGSENEILNCNWMRNHNQHLRNLVPNFKDYEIENENDTLLNCGVIGGNLVVITKLFNLMVALHKKYTISNSSQYTLDMGVFNYTCRTFFNDKIYFGTPVNTQFKSYETLRKDCWFQHK